MDKFRPNFINRWNPTHFPLEVELCDEMRANVSQAIRYLNGFKSFRGRGDKINRFQK